MKQKRFIKMIFLLAAIFSCLGKGSVSANAAENTFYLTNESITQAMSNNGTIYEGALANPYGNPYVILQPGTYVIDEEIDLETLGLKGITLAEGTYHFRGEGAIVSSGGSKTWDTKYATIYFENFTLSDMSLGRTGKVYINQGTYANIIIDVSCEVTAGEFSGSSIFYRDVNIKQGTFYNGVRFYGDTTDGTIVQNIDVKDGGITVGSFGDCTIYDGTVKGTIDAYSGRTICIYQGTYEGNEYAIVGPRTGFGIHVYGGTFSGSKASIYIKHPGGWYDELPMELYGGTFATGTEGAIIWNRDSLFPSGLEGRELYDFAIDGCFWGDNAATKEVKIDSDYASVVYEKDGKSITVAPHQEESNQEVPATCTKDGQTGGSHCSSCSAILQEATVIPSKGHEWGEWAVTTSATYLAEGVETRPCLNCDDTQTRAIDQLPNPFVDIEMGQYFYEPVLWALDNNITAGITAASFEPLQPCTRAQIVTFLWRTQGKPKAESTACVFADVNYGEYYYDAMLWAVENGIAKGYSDTLFGTNETCTRAEIVTFLWRMAGQPIAESKEHPFVDVTDGTYYYEPMLWAVENKIVSGYTPDTFAPFNTITRAETVTLLYRAFQ